MVQGRKLAHSPTGLTTERTSARDQPCPKSSPARDTQLASGNDRSSSSGARVQPPSPLIRDSTAGCRNAAGPADSQTAHR